MANDLSAFIPQIWSRRIVTRINQINVMLPLVNRDYEGEIRAAGDTVWVRTYGDVTLDNYQRGNPITYQTLAPTKESLVVNIAKDFAFAVDDLDTAQNDLNALDGYTGRAAVSISNNTEAFLQSFYGSAPTANQVTNSGSAITISSSNAYSTLVSAGTALDTQNLPMDNRWAIVTPTFKGFLVKDSTYFIRATDMGDNIVISGLLPNGQGGFRNQTVGEAMQRGYIGKAAGFDIFMSTAAPTDATGRYCLFGQGAPISYAAQLAEVEALRLQTTFATAVRGLNLYGGKVFAEYAKKLGYMLIGATQ